MVDRSAALRKGLELEEGENEGENKEVERVMPTCPALIGWII